MFSIILVVISVALALLTSYLVSFKIISDKAEYIDQSLTNVAVEKTNTILGELANVINLSINNSNLNYIMENHDMMSYDYINAKSEYEKFLRKLIMNYDKIDGIALVNDETMVYAKNSVLRHTSQNILTDYFHKTRELIKDEPESQFFLEKYTEERTQNIAIIQPALRDEQREVQAVVIIILNKNFSKELQFAGDSMYLMDQRGEYASINTAPEKMPFTRGSYTKYNGIIEKELVFRGWKIINYSTMNKIMEDIQKVFLLYLKLGILYIFISIILVHVVSKRLVEPIMSLSKRIKKLSDIKNIDEGFYNIRSSKLSFRMKLLIFCSFLVTIPVIGISGGFYINSKNIIQNKVGLISEYSADLLSQQINFVFKKYLHATVEIITDDKVQEYLYDYDTIKKVGKENNTINEAVIQKQTQNQGIMNVSLYDNNNDFLYSSFFSKYFIEMVGYANDLKMIDSKFVTPLWKGVTESYFNKGYFTIGMQIRGVSPNVTLGRKMGYILLYFDRNEISRIVNEFSQYGSAIVYLVDEDDKKALEMNKTGVYPILVSRYMNGEAKTKADNFEKLSKEHIVIERKIDCNGWKLVIITPMKEYMKENRTFLFYSIVIVLGLVILCFLFSYSFSLFLGKNIEELLDVVREVKKGDLGVRFKKRTVDEIGELGKSFNEMLKRMNTIIDEKLKYEIKAKDAEIKAKEYELNLLQAQINPHFLYNTLKTIQYMIYCKDARAEKMIKLLIYLLQTGISRGEKMVRFSEELQHVKTYLQIQQYRFSEKFNVRYEIPEDISDLYILKLTLQPIVENAIYHGLELCVGKGDLVISAKRCSGSLVITISDNGVGITAENLDELKDQLEGKSKSRGIGIINVHERMQLHFGKEYGIVIDSKKTFGTTVTLLFPILDRLQDKSS